MVKVTATHSKHIDVELDDFTVRQIVISQVGNVFHILDNYYIKDGKVMKDEEVSMGSHSMTVEHFVRDATDNDVLGIAALKILCEAL